MKKNDRHGYLIEKDLEDILQLSGLSLTKNEVIFQEKQKKRKRAVADYLFFLQTKILVSRIVHNGKIHYHQLTDKALPVNDNSSTDYIELKDIDIDPMAPKGNYKSYQKIRLMIFLYVIGNLLLLPQYMSVYIWFTFINNE